jgi:hypothetical protein
MAAARRMAKQEAVGPRTLFQGIGGAVDARIPRILHSAKSGNGRAVSWRAPCLATGPCENSTQREMSDVTVNWRRGVNVVTTWRSRKTDTGVGI